MSLVVLTLMVLNAKGRPVTAMSSPHSRGWYLAVYNLGLHDADGKVVTPESHPSEFAERSVTVSYDHGWPYTICARSAYLGEDSFLWGTPEDDPSSAWPIDSAQVIWARNFTIAKNLCACLGLLVIAAWFAKVMIMPCQTRIPDESNLR